MDGSSTSGSQLDVSAHFRQRFGYHRPPTPEAGEACNVVRTECALLAEKLDRLMPPGRELALALTKLEEVMFHANAGIARAWGPPGPLHGE